MWLNSKKSFANRKTLLIFLFFGNFVISQMAKEEKVWQKFVFGGFSGMAATLVVQPVDLIKNRMQMSGVGVATKAVCNC